MDTSRQQQHRRRRLIVVVAAVVVVVVAATSLGVGVWNSLNASASSAMTAKATLSDEQLTVTVTGALAAQDAQHASFSLAGTVKTVDVTVGTQVVKGQKLATLDEHTLQNALTQAKASLSAAQANLALAKSSGQSAAAVKAAQASVTYLQQAANAAVANVKSATLTAPMAGVVSAVGISVGDSVNPSPQSTPTPGIDIISPGKWQVDGNVAVADWRQLKVGQTATIAVDQMTGTLSGTVASVGQSTTASVGDDDISSQILNLVGSGGSSDSDTAPSTTVPSNTVPVVIAVNGDHALNSGVSVQALVTVGDVPNVLVVPTLAITIASGSTAVTVVQSGRHIVRPVTTGRVFGDTIEITKGLTQGETVVVAAPVVVDPSSIYSVPAISQDAGHAAQQAQGVR